MNKFQIAYYVVLVLFLATLSSMYSISCQIGFGGFSIAMDLLWIPLLVSGGVAYVLKDWRNCSIA